jgi:drug/metabolite transporter (DMT)-like permease
MTAAIFLCEVLGPLQSLGAVFVLIASVLASSREQT